MAQMWPGRVSINEIDDTCTRCGRYKLSRVQLPALTTREEYDLGKTDYPPDVLEKVYSKALLKCVLGGVFMLGLQRGSSRCVAC